MSAPLYLFGGGWREAAYIRTYWDFVQAARAGGDRPRIAIVIAEEEGLHKCEADTRWRSPFRTLGVRADDVVVLFASAAQPLAAAALAAAAPTALFVAGGAAPALHAALCVDRGWCAYVDAHALPCAGFAAGASIMAERAVVGGWLRALAHQDLVVLNREYAEQIDYIDVRDGLGRVPFAVETNAAHLGTVTRLAHAVLDRRVSSGWAIDEDTVLKIEDDTLAVLGLGQAWRVRRLEHGALRVDVFGAGTLNTREHW